MSFLSNDGSEDSASGVTMVEGRRLNATVSFMDWANKRHDFAGGKRMERMGSGVSCGDSAGSGNGGIGHWLEQMQIHQGQYGVYMKHPLEGIRCENKGSPGATGEGKSLSSPVVTGERERERESLWSPVTTGEEKSLCSPGVTGESESLCSPGGTGEGKSRRLHMFDKVVTPSDVGKLNRLVIPKHHAEKYFPLDSSEKDKGLLLTFRDSAGKEWRFRYSYWSSSQSYVLTKGWSRFVREMKLHAGDVVSFHRDAHSNSNSNSNMQQHFYISWKRRAAKAALFFSPFEAKSPPLSQWMAFAPPLPVAAPPWGERLNGPPPKEAILGREPPQFMKLKAVEQPPIENVTAKPVKRVRLFGVNL